LTKIAIEPEVIARSKIHPTIIARATAIMESESQYPQRPTGKGKWLEPVNLGDMRLGMSCHRLTEDIIAVTNVKRIQG
jgi:hypothetical protein